MTEAQNRKHTIACDLDGTLVHYDRWPDDGSIGAPIPGTVARVKAALAAGHEVWIFTARVADTAIPPGQIFYDVHQRIEAWCVEHLGAPLPITATKRPQFDEFWDDKAMRVAKNAGHHSLNPLPLWLELSPCRRCSECEGEEHHWLALGDSIDPDDADAVAEFMVEHPGVEPTEALLLGHQSCKHCPAVRPWDGEDVFDDEDEPE